MSTKQQLAEAIAALPDSISIEEAVDRLYRAFKLKQAVDRMKATRAQQASVVPSPGARLGQLVEEDRITEARALAQEVNDPRWIAALAPAEVRVADHASGAGLDELLPTPELLSPFVGQWVALRAGQVLGAAPRRGELRRQMAERGQLAGSVFIKVEE